MRHFVFGSLALALILAGCASATPSASGQVTSAAPEPSSAGAPWFGAGLIPGANADALTASLEAQGFACSDARALPPSITHLPAGINQWTCARDDGHIKYNLTVSGDDASHLHDLNAVALFLAGQSLADMNKDWFLPFVAELSYNGAQPAQVKTWLAQSPSDPLVIAGVNFLLTGSNNYLGLRIFGAE